jgi:uncharacterized RDD family membrane protein YckC
MEDDAKFCPSCGHQVGAAAATSPLSGTPLDKISSDSEAQTQWLMRVVAYVIDSIIVWIVAYFLLLITPFAFLNLSLAIAFTGSLYAGVIMFLYASFMEASFGGTVGKRLLGMKVTLENGGKAGFEQTLVRSISKVFWVLLLLDLLGGLFTKGDYRQRYSDRLSKTIVVKG